MDWLWTFKLSSIKDQAFKLTASFFLVCPLKQKAGLWMQGWGDTSSPREKVHTTSSRLPSSWFQANELYFLPLGSMGQPGIPARNFSSRLRLARAGSCSAPGNQIIATLRFLVLHHPDSGDQMGLKEGQEPGVRSQMDTLPHTPR